MRYLDPNKEKGDREQFINKSFFDDGMTSDEINTELKKHHWKRLDHEDTPYDDLIGDVHQLEKGLKSNISYNLKFTEIKDPGLDEIPAKVIVFDWKDKNYTLWVEDNDYTLTDSDNPKDIIAYGRTMRNFFMDLREKGKLTK